MKFNICILPTSIHTQAFAEIADSIGWALQRLGHDVIFLYKLQLSDPELRNIVFGLRPGDPTASYLPPNTIIYNGEQVTTEGLWPALVGEYKRFTIWDYSAANAERYADWELSKPVVVRPGDCPVLTGRIPALEERPYDVCFFGSMNPRRRAVLDDLIARGLQVDELPMGMYGSERDDRIAQSKLVLNVHYYEAAVFEALRCAPLVQNGVAVVSEKSIDDEQDLYGIVGVDYAELAGYVQTRLTQHAKCTEVPGERPHILSDVRAALAAPAPERAPAKSHELPPLTLSMIVKNEAPIIERCLSSVRPLLKHWCIVDTGSTDGTQEIIRRFMSEVPGTLHELPWKEFDGSRTDAMDLARWECSDEGWLLLIDADEILQVDGPLSFPGAGYDCYNGWVARCRGCQQWARPTFARASKPWFYEMPRHEGLYCRTHAPSAPEPYPGVLVLSMPDGGRSNEDAREKFTRDAKVLEKWYLGHPEHARCQYYIAQSYRDAAEARLPVDRSLMSQAIMHYQRRGEMPGYEQETFSALYQAARCMSAISYPVERIVGQLLKAFNHRPTRAEPLFDLAKHYRETKQWPLAELFARRASALAPAGDHFPDYEVSVYDWRAKEELAVALTWLGRYEEALAINMGVIEKATPHERLRIQENRDMCIRMLGNQPKGRVVRVSSGDFLEGSGSSG